MTSESFAAAQQLLLRSAPESTGTTLVAIECVGGVAVAVDSRTSSGSYVSNRATDKITVLDKHIVLLRAGSQADTQALADVTMYYAEANAVMDEEDEISVRNVANYARKMHYSYRGQLDSSFIVAGYDSILKGQIYAVSSGGYTIRQPFIAKGSGGTYIHDFLHTKWKEGLESEMAREIVKTAVFEAQKLDGVSGGLILTAVINKDGISRKTYRPDKGDFPTVLPVKYYPNLPTHIPQPGLVGGSERMET